MKLAYADVAQRHAQYLNPAFIKLLGTLGYGRLFTRAEDVAVWDDTGKKYLDFNAGFGSITLGHSHPKVVRAMHEALESKSYNFLHLGPSGAAADFAEALARRVPRPLEMTLLASSGAEAVEGAMKLAVRVTGRSKFVYMDDAFHGTSLGTLAVMGRDHFRKPFEKILPQNYRVDFDDLEALESVLRGRDVAAVLLEPVLCEGGVRFPAANYFEEVQKICRRHKTLLVFDEIQTGLGRTGALFSCSRMKEPPDVLVLAKALSGGLMPISATVTTRALFEKAFGGKDDFDLHSSTFAGNALACVAAKATLEVIDDEKLVENSQQMGALLLARLKEVLKGHLLVRDVRGQGLLVGVDIGPTDRGLLNQLAPGLVGGAAEMAIGQWMALCLLEKGILIQPSSHRWNVLKFEPPLTIKAGEIEAAVQATKEVFDNYRSVSALAVAISKRLGSQFFSGLGG
ncbi:MAG: aspartate aminotransferase family protein [Deltaproteobacteria bacterium]|nr:aspartate aminotransferase family protein [Deltaproteobacteria bacterium]